MSMQWTVILTHSFLQLPGYLPVLILYKNHKLYLVFMSPSLYLVEICHINNGNERAILKFRSKRYDMFSWYKNGNSFFCFVCVFDIKHSLSVPTYATFDVISKHFVNTLRRANHLIHYSLPLAPPSLRKIAVCLTSRTKWTSTECICQRLSLLGTLLYGNYNLTCQRYSGLHISLICVLSIIVNQTGLYFKAVLQLVMSKCIQQLLMFTLHLQGLLSRFWVMHSPVARHGTEGGTI